MAGDDPLRSRLKGLEFLRAACALVVLLNHVYCEGADLPQFTPIVAIAAYSVEAVMGFFVLSGCVIALQGYDRAGPYFRARLVRILPIYYVVLAISLAAMVACGAHFGAWQLIGNLLFLQTLDWSPLNPLRFFIPSWSLSYELYYYAAFILIMLVPRLLLPLLLGSIAVGIALYFTPLPAPAMWLLHAFSFFAMWLAGVLITRLVRAGYTVVPKAVEGRTRGGERVPLHRLWTRRWSTCSNGVSWPVQKAMAALCTPEGQGQMRELVDFYKNPKPIMDKMIDINKTYDGFWTLSAPLNDAGLKILEDKKIGANSPDGTYCSLDDAKVKAMYDLLKPIYDAQKVKLADDYKVTFDNQYCKGAPGR